MESWCLISLKFMLGKTISLGCDTSPVYPVELCLLSLHGPLIMLLFPVTVTWFSSYHVVYIVISYFL